MKNNTDNPSQNNNPELSKRSLTPDERVKIIRRYLYTILISLTLFITYWIITDYSFQLSRLIDPIDIFSTLISTFSISAFIIIYFNLSLSLMNTKKQRKAIEKDLKNSPIELDVDKNLIETSFKYLDQYYLQTREHAQKGFIVTVSVSIVGAVIIAIGIFSLFLGKTNPAYVTTACGIITEFIAAVYFYLYNKTIQGMNSYHNKLVLSQNIALALKLSHTLENKKDDAKMLIIQELMKDVNTHIEN